MGKRTFTFNNFLNFSLLFFNMNPRPEQASSTSLQDKNNLFCDERIEERHSELFNDRSSVLDFHRKYLIDRQSPKFRTELDPEDVKVVNGLGQLSADKLMDYIKGLQTSAVSLGNEESLQFTRAKLLRIFDE
ncbi:hypothetical protein Mgra_00003287 [Meloidogyne graminicola]|uniref:Uncharacterized protein n=1 Tax=Meloidogyne graminicola TaxID=189291 RepID=A0A8S9ZVS3_9BILA|nr:hypothetical protein Mgra_00003287 [Meloidogyne graminicola]